MIKKNNILINIGLGLIALICAFGVGEISTRLLFKDKTVLFPRYHQEYKYGRYTLRGTRPNTEFWHTSIDGSWKFVTNSKGYRSTQEYDYEKPANTIRILVLGDSHTQGHEVRQEATYSAVIERYLNMHIGKADVINTGVSGFSNAEELVYLENEGFKYSPDVVVLGFFANDFEDNMKAGLFELDNSSQLVEKKYKHTPGVKIQEAINAIPLMRWISENSYFYSMLFNGIWNYYKERLVMKAKSTAINGSANQLNAVIVHEPEYAVPTSRNYTPQQIVLSAALIDRMRRFCINHGIQFILVDIPKANARYGFESSLPEELEQSLKNNNVDYISAHGLLNSYNGCVDIHVPNGYNHISEFTHAHIGVEIGRRIRNMLNIKKGN